MGPPRKSRAGSKPRMPQHLLWHPETGLFLSFFVFWCGGCCCLVTKSCPTLCGPMGCSPPGSSVHRLLQGKILEWVVIFFSRGSSRPRDWTCLSCIGRRILDHWVIREAHLKKKKKKIIYLLYWVLEAALGILFPDQGSHRTQGFSKATWKTCFYTPLCIHVCLQWPNGGSNPGVH